MTHGSLFSGIGGFDLAALAAGFTNVWSCEKDPFPRSILQKRFPKTIHYEDILKTDWTQAPRVELISGGFPCQPFSLAGKMLAYQDDRFLWPAMLGVIRQMQPRWIVGENVAGIVQLALDGVCDDLEALGYAVWPVVIPAAAVGAPHQRDRVWIIAGQPTQPAAHAESGQTAGGKRFGFLGDPVRGLPAFDGRSQFTGFQTEVIRALCGGDDGLSGGLDKPDRQPDGRGNFRAKRLKALGNAIVPQVAYEIFKTIKAVESANIF